MERIEDSLTICKLLFKSRKYVELIKYCDELLEKYSENGVCKILYAYLIFMCFFCPIFHLVV